MTSEVLDLDAIGQAELIQSGQVSALEVIEGAIRRVEARNESLSVLAGADFERARDRARRDATGPLAGVPFLIKDLIPYPGIRCSMGCRLFANHVPEQSSAYSERIDEAGLTVLGKTTTSELGLLGSTESLLEGVTRNPWDVAMSAGGSSGGSAAAVASRMVPMAHASDGGGSIRIPAALNGVFGFKPSRHRTVASGIDDLNGLLVDHCVSRSVRDSAFLLSLTERDIEGTPRVGFVEGPSADRLRIGFYSETLMGASSVPEVTRVLERTADLCSSLGHTVESISAPPVDGQRVSDSFFVMAGAGIKQLSNVMAPVLGRPPGSEELEPFTLSLLAWFDGLPAEALQDARSAVGDLGRQMAAFLEPYDVVLCPTLPISTVPLGTLAPTLPYDALIERTEHFAGFTPIHNMAGVPAMSVPLFVGTEGLPIGSHFAASMHDEDKLLRLAYELEAAAPWRDRAPPLL